MKIKLSGERENTCKIPNDEWLFWRASKKTKIKY